MTRELFLLWPMTDEPHDVDQAWLNEFRRCHTFACRHRDERYRPRRLRIGRLGQNVPLTFSSPVVIGIIRDDLKDALSPEIIEHCVFHDLEYVGVDPDAYRRRRVCQQLHTYWPRRRTNLRGGPKSYCDRCKTCRQLFYCAMGRWYLVRSGIPDVPIFGASGGLVVTENLRKRLAGKTWRKMNISRMTILDEPRDGFPVNLNRIRPEQERSWQSHYGDK